MTATLKVIAKEISLPCNLILITPRIPFKAQQIAAHHELKIVSWKDEPGCIEVTRYTVAIEEDKQKKGFEIHGSNVTFDTDKVEPS